MSNSKEAFKVSRILKWMKKETLSILPAVFYFFCAINLFNMTFGWMLEVSGQKLLTFPRIIISSLIIGKIMLVADVLPILNIFSGKPLIYNTLWKTSIYSFFGILVFSAERFVPVIFKYGGTDTVWQHIVEDTPWARFCTAQVWLVVLFLLFVIFRELGGALGKGKLRQIFFGG